jgi:hypothetical protein
MTTAFKPDLDRLRLMVADDNISLSRLEVLATAQRIYDRPGLPTACVHRMPQGMPAVRYGACQRCGAEFSATTKMPATPPFVAPLPTRVPATTETPATPPLAPDSLAVPSRKFMVVMDWATLTGIFSEAQLARFFKMDGDDIFMPSPVQVELMATAPQGAVHLRLKEYK